MRPIADQTILITGATDGHGQALATELGARQATVLVHGRDDDRGQHTIDQIRQRTGNERLHWIRADLSSLQDTKMMAEQINTAHDRLDALVNNAGIGTTDGGADQRVESRSGYELRFAVNYLAGYLLTRLLLPLLKSSPASPPRQATDKAARKRLRGLSDQLLALSARAGRVQSSPRSPAEARA